MSKTKQIFSGLVLILVISCTPKEKETSGQNMLSGQTSSDPSKVVVAEVDGQKITEFDLLESLKVRLYEMDKKIHAMKKRELDKLVINKLVESRARKENMTVDEYNKQVVTVQLKVSKAEVEAFFKKNKDRIQGSKDEATARIKKYLTQKKERNFHKKILNEARKENKIKTFLVKPDSPTFNVSTDDDPFLGSSDAKVTIIEFSDFECPFCARVKSTIHKLKDQFKGKVKIVYRDFPLSFHSYAKLAAVAAECADDQGKFWEYHDKLYDNQKFLKEEHLIKYAGELQLKVNEFKQCLKDESKMAEVEKDIRDGRQLGIKSTPTFFINGKMFSGVLSFNDFKKKIDELLGLKQTAKN